jgi:hypothetical protein
MYGFEKRYVYVAWKLEQRLVRSKVLRFQSKQSLDNPTILV